MAWMIVRLSARLFYRRLGTFLAANVLWLITSLPIVTMPAAAGGLFYLMSRVIADERDLDPDESAIGDFWVGFRRYWKQFSLIGFLDLAVVLLLGFTTYFYWQHPVELFNWLAGPLAICLLTFFFMQLYLFPLRLAYPEESVWSIFRRAFFLVITRPMDTVLLVTWLLILTAVCLTLAGPVLFLLFSTIALVQTFALRIIRIERGEIPGAIIDELKENRGNK
ncbi:MAG: DUF624 domain-containing protein [Ardenticatenaceae bacterium]|nr:DUF624 domain-containing protein [Anaerolineales bacterium]MCB8937350.1 DUF624 domain-containing protein [Ardenticatenaceae bacterium]MCB8975456.1 DUF624 domain-containing protein [Ardenticatenaceae bacterium]